MQKYPNMRGIVDVEFRMLSLLFPETACYVEALTKNIQIDQLEPFPSLQWYRLSRKQFSANVLTASMCQEAKKENYFGTDYFFEPLSSFRVNP